MTKAGMQIHPIRTVDDHRAAIARIEQLISATPDSPEGDELDVLATLVDAYEAKHHLIDAPDPVSAIEFRMEQQALSRKDLEPMIGSRARVSEVMTGKRPLTLAMVRRVRNVLGISADLLILPVPASASNPLGARIRPEKITARSRPAEDERARKAARNG
jgi:HTH-type transcriptional regulator/antitoxin HigA